MIDREKLERVINDNSIDCWNIEYEEFECFKQAAREYLRMKSEIERLRANENVLVDALKVADNAVDGSLHSLKEYLLVALDTAERIAVRCRIDEVAILSGIVKQALAQVEGNKNDKIRPCR
jgi:hypothetical protein